MAPSRRGDRRVAARCATCVELGAQNSDRKNKTIVERRSRAGRGRICRHAGCDSGDCDRHRAADRRKRKQRVLASEQPAVQLAEVRPLPAAVPMLTSSG